MKVFITTYGEYSDYGLDRVFSTKENAQLYLDSISKKDHGGVNDQIIQAQVDSMISILRQGFNIYYGRMDIDGNTQILETRANQIETHKNNVYDIVGIRQYISGEKQYTYNHMLRVKRDKSLPYVEYDKLPLRTDFKEYNVIKFHVLAKSEQHAAKIVNEKRAQFITNGLFTQQAITDSSNYIYDVQDSLIPSYAEY